MIERFTIKLAPTLSHAEMQKIFEQGATFTAEQLQSLSKVKAKVEIVGDYADMEKIRDLISTLSKE